MNEAKTPWGWEDPDSKDYNDLIEAGFERVEAKSLKNHAPKILWGSLYRNKSLEDRLAYAERLAAAMNHAAATIQEERNELGRLAELKEKQLHQMKASLDANNAMIQRLVTEANAEKQAMQAAFVELKARIRELESGNNG